MTALKVYIKKVFYSTNLLGLFDKLVFFTERIKYRKKNRKFKIQHPGIVLPPDYFLYETYLLDYGLYVSDGDVSAKEIIEWTNPYVPSGIARILEWGCGTGRIIRHIGKYLVDGAELFACDINSNMIEWNRKHIPQIKFSLVDYLPPTTYEDDSFSLAYAVSVLTHIDAASQDKWLQEMHRLLQKQGVFLFTTHGRSFSRQLLPSEQKTLLLNGAYTRKHSPKGHRLMTTYNEPAAFKKSIEKYFSVLEYHNGSEHPDKIGGQDLWIVQKADNAKG